MRFNGGNLAVAADLVQIQELKRILAIVVFGQEIAISGGQEFHQKRFTVARFTDKDKGHFLGRTAFGRIFHIGNKTVDLLIHADDVFGSFAEDFKIVGCLAVHHHFFNFAFQDHAGHSQEGIFKPQLAVLDGCHVLMKGYRIFRHFSSPCNYGLIIGQGIFLSPNIG